MLLFAEISSIVRLIMISCHYVGLECETTVSSICWSIDDAIWFIVSRSQTTEQAIQDIHSNTNYRHATATEWTYGSITPDLPSCLLYASMNTMTRWGGREGRAGRGQEDNLSEWQLPLLPPCIGVWEQYTMDMRSTYRERLRVPTLVASHAPQLLLQAHSRQIPWSDIRIILAYKMLSPRSCKKHLLVKLSWFSRFMVWKILFSFIQA